MEAITFEEILKYPYVIIYDNANGNKIHKMSCSFVKEESFNKKMIENEGKNGYYRPVNSFEEIDDPSVVPCKKCNS